MGDLRMNGDAHDLLIREIIHEIKKHVPDDSSLWWNIVKLLADYDIVLEAQRASIERAVYWWEQWNDLKNQQGALCNPVQ